MAESIIVAKLIAMMVISCRFDNRPLAAGRTPDWRGLGRGARPKRRDPSTSNPGFELWLHGAGRGVGSGCGRASETIVRDLRRRVATGQREGEPEAPGKEPITPFSFNGHGTLNAADTV